MSGNVAHVKRARSFHDAPRPFAAARPTWPYGMPLPVSSAASRPYDSGHVLADHLAQFAVQDKAAVRTFGLTFRQGLVGMWRQVDALGPQVGDSANVPTLAPPELQTPLSKRAQPIFTAIGKLKPRILGSCLSSRSLHYKLRVTELAAGPGQGTASPGPGC